MSLQLTADYISLIIDKDNINNNGEAVINILDNKNFIFHGTRNQNEEFEGIITDMYPAVFVIKVSSGQIRTFSYSDLLIKNLEIIN